MFDFLYSRFSFVLNKKICFFELLCLVIKEAACLRHVVATPLQDPTYSIKFQQIRHINYYMSVTFFVVVKSVKRC